MNSRKRLPTSNGLLSSSQQTFGRALLGHGVSRRKFIRQAAGIAAGLGVGASWPVTTLAKPHPHLPKPDHSGIDHIVLVMMENRSFDHFLGWLPGADGRQAGLVYLDSKGNPHPTHALAPDYQGCAHPDPDHSYAGARVEYDNGMCDGWLRAGSNDDYAIGYYLPGDLSFLGSAAPAWTVCDRYFAAILSSTFPNRLYVHAAQTDRLDDSLTPLSTLPTIWDRLAEAGVEGKYYYSDIPFLALWGATYLGISHGIDEFFTDAAAGTLPAVSYVDPRFLGETEGLTNDDHPHADIRNGEVFLNSIYEAVTSGPDWPSTMLVIVYDEWGGFFDHVPPTRAPIPPSDATLGSDGFRGFRVPSVVISPWVARRNVEHTVFDHTSILNMIEWRFGLDSMTIRDRTANNFAEVLDWPHKHFEVPRFNVPSGPFGTPCALQTDAESANAAAWLEMAAEFGFKVPG